MAYQTRNQNQQVDKIAIEGGKKLEGTIDISGAKNAALPIIAASLLAKEEVILHNVPRLGDIYTLIDLLKSVGAKITYKNGTVHCDAANLTEKALANNALANEIRYSIHVASALLSRINKIRIPVPGGCAIGTRRLDSYIQALTMLGARVDIKNEHIELESGRLRGSHISLEYPSVSATENALIVACLVDGTSVVENVAKEPEVVDLANFLNSMGAKIEGAGTEVIRLKGVDKLSGTQYSIIHDRIETGTYIIASAITEGNILIKKADLSLLGSVVTKLREVGVEIDETNDGVRVASPDRLCPVDIVTEVYPGFPTDMQPIITPLLSMADGESTIKETIFDNRFRHVPELVKMGARIRVIGDTMFITTANAFKGTEVDATDIRSGGALILAGLIAEGNTTINNAHLILRGYEAPVEKLRNVGAQVYYVYK